MPLYADMPFWLGAILVSAAILGGLFLAAAFVALITIVARSASGKR